MTWDCVSCGLASHLLGLALCVVPAVLVLILGSTYRRKRLMTFLAPWKDASDAGFQITQSFLAFGSGGPFGVGLGEGKQKLFFLPEAHTDFVLALVGEELGWPARRRHPVFGSWSVRGLLSPRPYAVRVSGHGITLLMACSPWSMRRS